MTVKQRIILACCIVAVVVLLFTASAFFSAGNTDAAAVSGAASVVAAEVARRSAQRTQEVVADAEVRVKRTKTMIQENADEASAKTDETDKQIRGMSLEEKVRLANKKT